MPDKNRMTRGRAALPLLAIGLAAGCQSYSRPVEKPDAQLSRAQLDARGDELIERGNARRLEGMNMSQALYRRGGPNKFDVIEDGESMIRHGRRLKAMATTRPD